MKTRNILSAIAALAFMVPVQSCLKDQTEVFEESPSARLNAYNESVRKALCDGTWIMEYYAGANQSVGGFTYIMDFTETEVTVKGELSDKSATTPYRLTADNGPVLSFDVYNEVFHNYATPSSSKYQGNGGDFEFTIISHSDDEVILKAKRSGNRYTLKKAEAGFDADKYLQGIIALRKSYRAPALEGMIGDVEVTGAVNIAKRSLTLSYDKGEVDDDGNTIFVDKTSAFVITPKGFHLYNPIEINGYTIRDLFYLPVHNSLTNGVITFQGKLPEGYHFYEDLAGNYTFASQGLKKNITLTPDEEGTGFIATGLIKGLNVRFGYDSSFGGLTLTAQPIENRGSTTIFLIAVDISSGGYISEDESVGVDIRYDTKKGKFLFHDNGVWEDLKVDSFAFWEFSTSGDSVGQFSGYDVNGFFYLDSMTKL